MNQFEKLIKLIEKNHIKPGTIISVKVETKIFGSGYSVKSKEFIIEGIKVLKDNILYIVGEIGSDDSKKYLVSYKHVYKYDGMSTNRFIASYSDLFKSSRTRIDPVTGLPVKRGRKPKWYKQALLDMSKTNHN